MSEKGDKICPLCTEDMDLTDQQLKPCDCGYEVCVWCWHHIMEMAEKDTTEGRCPACRSPYDKEKIVGMAADCERLVAEINSDRKQKSQKTKPKASEGRMHLSNVRVIKRNLVYIIGLPLNLADEELLQRREYFGKYGKVLKVSISKTANGVIQHSSNNSCCVYVTYSKEEEAVRCIQSVHSFVLEGRSLRACFGTTKYCHAWLKNVHCSIPDCLYLHDYGSQEDSFCKDEIVSAFARSRVQQVIGASNNLHRRSGNVLPPPVDVCSNGSISSTAKSVAKISSHQNIGNQNGESYTDSGTRGSDVLPTATSWVTRVSVSLPSIPNLSVPDTAALNNKPEANAGPEVVPKVSSTEESVQDLRKAMPADETCEMHPNFKLDHLELAEGYVDGNCQTPVSNRKAYAISGATSATIKGRDQFCFAAPLKGIKRDTTAPISIDSSIKLTKLSCHPGSGEIENLHVNGGFQDLSVISNHSHLKGENSIPAVLSSVSNHFSVNLPRSQSMRQDISKQLKTAASDDLLDFDDAQRKNLESFCNLPSMSCTPSVQNPNQSSYFPLQLGEVKDQPHVDAHPTIAALHDKLSFALTCENLTSSLEFSTDDDRFTSGRILDDSAMLMDVRPGSHNKAATADNNVAPDTGESSIISKILSIDLDPWEDSLTSPASLARLLRETDKHHGSLKTPSLRKLPNNNQSRFSFARQDDFHNQASDLGDSLSSIVDSNKHATSHDLPAKELWIANDQEAFSLNSSVGSDSFISGHSAMGSKFSASQVPTSTPPGFSVSSRAPPPGFPTHGSTDMPFDSAVSHLLQMTEPIRNVVGSVDVDYINPAILKAGNGVMATGLNNLGLDARWTSPVQHTSLDHVQPLMQQSVYTHQNQTFQAQSASRFSPSNGIYSVSQMLVDQFQASNPSAFLQQAVQQSRNAYVSNGHRISWNEDRSINDLNVSELIKNGGLEFNKFIPGYEDLMLQVCDSSNLCNRGFAM